MFAFPCKKCLFSLCVKKAFCVPVCWSVLKFWGLIKDWHISCLPACSVERILSSWAHSTVLSGKRQLTLSCNLFLAGGYRYMAAVKSKTVRDYENVSDLVAVMAWIHDGLGKWVALFSCRDKVELLHHWMFHALCPSNVLKGPPQYFFLFFRWWYICFLCHAEINMQKKWPILVKK